MSAFPGGYSDPNQYGSTFSQPVQPVSYPPGPSLTTQPAPGGGQTVNIQMDPNMQAMMQTMMAHFDPNNPTTNEKPVNMQCPSCRMQVTTQTEYVIGTCTWMSCVLCFCMGCPILMWQPFVSDWSKDVIHTCPSCKAECGQFIRSKQRSRRHVRAY